jgi:hypothetical protein
MAATRCRAHARGKEKEEDLLLSCGSHSSVSEGVSGLVNGLRPKFASLFVFLFYFFFHFLFLFSVLNSNLNFDQFWNTLNIWEPSEIYLVY